MRIRTFNIVAGSEACNASCPFCVSTMTPGLGTKEPEVNWRNFRKACSLAKQCGTTTAMITGKGEPTLFPEQITKYMDIISEYDFPLIEMQTNGIAISDEKEKYKHYLERWYEDGLNTIAISIVHYEPERNREIYVPGRKEYIDLPGLVDYFHGIGFSTRLSCILINGYVSDAGSVGELINFSKNNKVEQLTIRPMSRPAHSRNPETEKWVDENCISPESHAEIWKFVESEGNPLMQLAHGAMVYDVRGQNVCISNCLTIEPGNDELRQIIFFPDGHIRHDWQYEGAILL